MIPNNPKLIAALRNAEKLYARAESNGERRHAGIIKHAFEQLADHGNPDFMRALAKMKRLPVTIDEFVESREFLGSGTGDGAVMNVWDELRPELIAMNPDQLLGVPAVHEVLLAGATGWGKSNCSQITNAYQLYTLLCFDWPQELFGLSRSTPLVFMFSGVTATFTNRVLYKPFREMFTQMPFTKKYIEYNKQLEANLSIGQNIIVVPALASVQSMVGQAVISAIIDEINFMARIENSKQVVQANGAGGVYDQAEIAYTTLSRRRKSRFTTRGISPGCLCVASSTRYRGDFLDRRIQEIEVNKEPNTIVFRHAQYDKVPKTRFRGEKFRLLVGSDRWPTKVLHVDDVPGINYPSEARIEMVPEEYRSEFTKDPESALRDIVGIATDAISPFITQRDKVDDCISAGRKAGIKPILNRDEIVLAREQLPKWPSHFKPFDPDAPRFIHVDLAFARDRCGVAMVRHDGYRITRGERLPEYTVELAVGIKPDAMNQLQIADLREWILAMITKYELNVVQISYDGFNSKESQQVIRRSGIRSAQISVDRTPEAYELLRTTIYDGRILFPDNDLLRQELVQLEWLAHKGKVDHPVHGGKDVSDAVAGAMFAASKNPIVRSGVRAIDEDGNTIRSPFSMQRPSGSRRPSAEQRPRSSKAKRKDIEVQQMLEDGKLDEAVDHTLAVLAVDDDSETVSKSSPTAGATLPHTEEQP